MEVGDGVGQQGCLLRHLAVLFRVLLSLQSHLGHRVLQLAQLHGQTLVALLVSSCSRVRLASISFSSSNAFLAALSSARAADWALPGAAFL